MPFTLSRRIFVQGLTAAGAASSLGFMQTALARLRLVIVTGNTGGVFYPYGGGLAKILSEKGADIQATAQVTGGSVDNVKLLAAGEADLGFSTLDSAFDGLSGTGAYTDSGPQPVRVIATLYDSYLHAVAASSSGITSIAGMSGKRIGVGSAGSSTEGIADRVLAAAGIDPKNGVSRDNLSVAESAGALKDGKIDAFFWVGGLPTSAVKDLALSGQPALTFLPAAAEQAALEAAYPGLYHAMELPAATYQGQAAAVPGIGVANVLLVAETAPAELVTTVLATLFDHLDAVHQIHPEAAKLTLQGAARRTAVPVHPAAEAFYASRGVTAP